MVIFNKKNKKNSQKRESNEMNDFSENNLPQLPELPKLPEAPDTGYSSNQLPSFPSNNIGNQLSQNTIKEAVSGEKEEEDSWADDFDSSEEEEETMPEESLEMAPSPKLGGYNSYSEENKKERNFENKKSNGKNEPVFVRIDKFEEGLKTFEKLKDKTMEIEKLLKDVKKDKDEENKEIDKWEKELESMKTKIESLNRSIFSKIE